MTVVTTSASDKAWLAHFGPVRVYLWLGGLSLMLLVFLTPPFQVPDEPQHFYRSYQLSRGEVWSRVHDGVVGTDLPVSLAELERHFLGTNKNHTTRFVSPQPLRDTLAELRRPLEAGQTAFVDMSGIQRYAPLPYLPQAVGIALGRAAGAGPLGLLYCGRIGNALVAWLVTAMAIALLPIGRTIALLAALLPMTQFLTASVSPDAQTIASAFLLTAVLARFLVDHQWSVQRQLLAFVSGLVMCIVKPVYLPLLFSALGTMVGKSGFTNKGVRRAVVSQCVAAATIVGIFVAWSWSVPSGGGGGGGGPAGVDASGQIAYLLQDVLRAIRIFVRSLVQHAEFLGQSTVGYLGWLTVKLPDWVYWLVAVAVPLGVLADQQSTRRISIAAILWLMLAVLAVVPLIQLAMYLGWTQVGGYFVEGVQGRYFIPALPMLGVGFAAFVVIRIPPTGLAVAYVLAVGILVAVTVAMHLRLIDAYRLLI